MESTERLSFWIGTDMNLVRTYAYQFPIPSTTRFWQFMAIDLDCMIGYYPCQGIDGVESVCIIMNTGLQFIIRHKLDQFERILNIRKIFISDL